MSDEELERLHTQSKPYPETDPRRAMIFFIYFIAGPPIGALVFMTFLAAMGIGSAIVAPSPDGLTAPSVTGVLETVGSFIVIVPVAMIFSYLFGGLQAAATGLVLILFADKQGKFGYGAAILAPIPSSLAAYFIIGSDINDFGALVAATGMLSSLILRFLFRKRYGRHASEIVTDGCAA